MEIFVYDIIKQLTGSIGIHFINLLLSILLSDGEPEISINTCGKIKKMTVAMKIVSRMVYFYRGSDTGGGTDNNNDDDDDKTQCSWYFLNLLSDCTFGVYILYYIMHRVNSVFENKFNFKHIESGNYWDLRVEKRLASSSRFKNLDDKSILSINGDIVKDPVLLDAIPEKHKYGYSIRINGPKFRILVLQTMVFFISLILMKLIIAVVLEIDLIGGILFHVTDEMLAFMSKLFQRADIFFVMFVAPICLNIFQYICIDTIIKMKPHLTRSVGDEAKLSEISELNEEYRFLIDSVSYEHVEESVSLLG